MKWKTTLVERAFKLTADVMQYTPVIARMGREQAHMSGQLFRAVSSIGSNLEEGQVALSRKDMAHKHAIALREARETVYWLRLLIVMGAMKPQLEPLLREAGEMVAMLTASVKKLRGGEPEDPGGSSKE